MVDYLSTLDKHFDGIKEIMALNEPILLKVLHEIGVIKILVSYSGSGDSGEIDDIEFFTEGDFAPSNIDVQDLAHDRLVEIHVLGSSYISDKWIPDLQTELVALYTAIEYYCNDWLEIEHPGYENDDGGQGEMTINVVEGEFILDHNDRYVQLANTITLRTAELLISGPTMEI